MTSTLPLRPSTNDLWACAAAELSEEDRKNINFSCPDKLNILSDLLTLTEKSRQECLNKRWRYTRNSGETVIFMDLFGKMVKWIDLFKEVGDAAVQYDPVHAALPWAGVRFLLQIAVNDHHNFAFVVEGATSIAEIICRYAIFEDVYLQSHFPAANELTRALVQLYATIMIYLSKTKSYFNQNSAKRIIKSGILAKSDLSSCFGAISNAQEAVHRCLELVGIQDQIERHKVLKNLLERINNPLKRLYEDFGIVKDDLETSKRTEIFRWTSPEPYIQHHEQTKKDVLSGTGQWLLSDPIFKQWKEESVSSILWLHGIPGSGKSKLISIVIEDAMQAFRAGQSPPPAFFYCSRNTAEPTRSSPEAIIASIARQLSSLQPGLPLLPPMVAAYKKREAEGFASGSLRIDESSALILQLVEYYPLTTIIIDALDECKPERRADLLETLETILQESSSLVKIFVSSRDDQDIVCHLQDYPNLELASNRNMNDIASFVRAETQYLIRRRKLLRFSVNKAELKESIIDQVTEGASGMFRWAALQLQSLCELKTDAAVRERIGRLPPQLEDLYHEVYNKFNNYPAEADRQITRNALSWLLCTQRRLSSAEFLATLSMTPRRCFSQVTKDQVLDMCCNMIVFDSTLDTFRFAHLSVREFLEKRREYSSIETNSLAAEICLLQLLSAVDNPTTKNFLFERGQTLLGSTGSHDFSSYSTIYWARHCQLASSKRTTGMLKDFFLFFLSGESDPTSAFNFWTGQLQEQLTYNIPWEFRRKLHDTKAAAAKALFIACSFDFSEVIQNTVDRQTVRAGYTNRNGLLALEVAVKHGSCEVISVLLSDELTQVTNEVAKAAAGNRRNGKEVTALLLQSRKAEVKITAEVIEAAATNKESGNEVMMLLFSLQGAEVNDVIILIGGKFDKNVMTLLLDQLKADALITKDVIQAIVGNKKSGKEIVTLLIKRQGARVQITREAITLIIKEFDREVVTLLLDQQGAEVEITKGVLKAAAGNEDNGKEVMMFLLDRQEANIQITKDVIEAATENWRSGNNIMALLLQRRGAEIHITEDITALIVGKFEKEVVILLLNQDGVQITEDVLRAAAGNEDSGKEVMMLLLDQQKASIQITESVMEKAAGNGGSGEEVLSLLFDRELAVQVTEDVIKAAARNRWSGKEVITLLFNRRGADIRITEGVLTAAAENGWNSEKVMALLLGWRADTKNTSKLSSGATDNFAHQLSGDQSRGGLNKLAQALKATVETIMGSSNSSELSSVPVPIQPQTRRPATSTRSGSNTKKVASSRAQTSSRRPASHTGQQAKPKLATSTRRADRSGSQLASILEYVEDRTILRRFGELVTFIDQHAVNFYPLDGLGRQGKKDLDEPRTRHAAIRRSIAKKIIGSIIMAIENSLPDICAITRELSTEFRGYAIDNDFGREEHLRKLCRLGNSLRILMENHPSSWEFGSWDEVGCIMMVPALLRGGELASARMFFRV